MQIYSIILDSRTNTQANGLPFRPGMIAKPWDQGAERQGPELLETLADKTGGLHFRVGSPAAAGEAAVKAASAIRTQYVIGYQPSVTDSAGKWHRLRVKSNLPNIVIHSRSGYYAP